MVEVRYIQFETQTPFTNETFGAFGVNSHTIDPIGEDITGDQQYIYPRTAGQRTIRRRITGPKKFSGTLNTPLYPIHAVSLLYYAMGTLTTTANVPTTLLNTHVIKKATSLPFFRAGIGRDLNEHQYVGGIVGGFTVDYSPSEVLTASFDVILRREKSPLGTLDTSVAFPDLDDAERTFGGSEITPLIDTVAATFVESATLTVSNNVADDAYALGNAHLPAGIIAAFESTGSFDLRYDANNRYTDWLDGTERRFELNAQFTGSDGQRDIKFNFPIISYDVNRLPTDNLERYVQALEWTAEIDSNGDPVIITVINAQENAQITG